MYKLRSYHHNISLFEHLARYRADPFHLSLVVRLFSAEKWPKRDPLKIGKVPGGASYFYRPAGGDHLPSLEASVGHLSKSLDLPSDPS